MNEYESRLSSLFAAGAFPEDAFHLDKVLGDRKLVVYGAGESFHYFKEIVMARYGYVPCAVLDRRFRRGDTFEGVPAFSPLEYAPADDLRRNALVIVCLGNQGYFDEVMETLRAMGFRNIMTLRDIYEIHNPFLLPEELEREGFGYYLRRRQRIETVLGLFADDESREVYLRCLETHLSRKPVPIPMSPREEQYTPEGIPLKRGYSRFLYCGVSVGEMARVLSQVGKIDELVCFEPDPRQFEQAAAYLARNRERIAQRVSAFPCAVYSGEAIRPFTHSHTSFGSRVLESGESWIQCVAIDHVVPGFQPTFLNMDIEGAELEALEGARRTICESRPDLAVCVYHAPHHLWEVPLFLAELDLGYRFYLRNYTSFVSETVLYAAAP